MLWLRTAVGSAGVALCACVCYLVVAPPYPTTDVSILEIHAELDYSLVEFDTDDEDMVHWDSHRLLLGVTVELKNNGTTPEHFRLNSLDISISLNSEISLDSAWITYIDGIEQPGPGRGWYTIPSPDLWDLLTIQGNSTMILEYRQDVDDNNQFPSSVWVRACFHTLNDYLMCDQKRADVQLVM
jgi:hypothetical protein